MSRPIARSTEFRLLEPAATSRGSLNGLLPGNTARTSEKFDSVADIERLRQERTDELSGLR